MSTLTIQYITMVFLIIWFSYMGYRIGYQKGRYRGRMSVLDALSIVGGEDTIVEKTERMRILDNLKKIWDKEDKERK